MSSFYSAYDKCFVAVLIYNKNNYILIEDLS